jgi:hypothetical protein
MQLINCACVCIIISIVRVYVPSYQLCVCMQLINCACVCIIISIVRVYHLLARLALDAASPAPALLEAAVAATD